MLQLKHSGWFTEACVKIFMAQFSEYLFMFFAKKCACFLFIYTFNPIRSFFGY